MLRDFTDDAKERLQNAIRAAEAQDSGWIDNVLDFFADCGINGDIAHYGDDIKSYHTAIVDKKDTTITKLNAIFDAVYAVEGSYAPKFEAQRALLPNIAQTIAGLAELLNPQPADGGRFALTREPAEIQLTLANATGPLVRALIDSLCTRDASGEVMEYNWGKIGALLQTDAQQISGNETAALALLFLEMQDAEDMERFIALSYVEKYEFDENGNLVNRRYDLTDTYLMVTLTAQTLATSLADSALHSGLDAEQLGGFSQEQLNGYLVRAGILMDVADFGVIPIDPTSQIDRETLRLTGRAIEVPVNIELTEYGYTLEIATMALPGDLPAYGLPDNPPAFGDKMVLNGYAPPTDSESFVRYITDENSQFLQGQMPGASGFQRLLNSTGGFAVGKVIGKSVSSGLAGLGLVGKGALLGGVPGAVLAGAFSIGKSSIEKLLKDNAKIKEYGAMIDTNNQILAYGSLGYDMQYSVLGNNQLAVRYIPRQSPCDDYITQAAFNSYLQDKGINGGYTTEQITAVMLNGHEVTNATEGSVTTWVAQPMDAEQLRELGITAEQQQEIVGNMQNCKMHNLRREYIDELDEVLNDNSFAFDGKTNLDALTEEEVERLVNMGEAK